MSEFEPAGTPGLLGIARLELDLGALIGRPVDLRTLHDLSRILPRRGIRLRHLLEAAEKVIDFSSVRTRQSLEDDELLLLGLTKLVEIAGEYAKQISEPTRTNHPEVPCQWPRACATG